MRPAPTAAVTLPLQSVARRWWLFWALAALSVIGCSSQPSAHARNPGLEAPTPAAASTESPSATTTILAADGIRLHVRSLGPPGGRVVLLVHGGPGLDLESLRALDTLASSGRRIVGYDQRGAGQSTRPTDGDYGLAAQTQDLEAVRRWTGAKQVDIIGASWGGLLAAAYTAKHPSSVRSLVLLDAAPLDFREFEAGEQRFGRRVAQLQRLRQVPTPLPPDDGDSCLPSLTALLPVYLGDPSEQLAHPDFSSCTSSTSKASFAALRRRGTLDDLAANLVRFHGSALVVAGERDPFGSQWADRAAQLLSAAHVQRLTVPGAGHLPYLEKPSLVQPAIARFLSE